MTGRDPLKPFPGFENVFVLDDPMGRAFRGDYLPSDGEAINITRGEHIPASCTIRWAMGAQAPADVIRNTMANTIVVHQRVIDVLMEGKFTGWRT